MKYIIVTGGVISGLGKGITASSIGLILSSQNLAVTAVKIDPYLNVDAGTMSPYEHGECYVLADGGESDLDLGNYERFLDIELTREHNITTGKVYQSVIEKERAGEYLGKTVQVVPHVVDEIIERIERASHMPVRRGLSRTERIPDVCIIELGGTIGDIETSPFVEALRQLQCRADCCFVHVSLIVDNGEPKTKPTQHSVMSLRSLGITPDFLVLRCKEALPQSVLSKIHVSCNIEKHRIIVNQNTDNIYRVPDLFMKQYVGEKVLLRLSLKSTGLLNAGRGTDSLDEYYDVLSRCCDSHAPVLRVGIAGKYVNSQDTYLSLIRAINHAAMHIGRHAELVWINAEEPWETISELLHQCNVVIIPGGFGTRGIDGKIAVARHCRENDVPMLGICLGMQVMAVEYARYLGHNATSREWMADDAASASIPVIDILPDQDAQKLGGTMRLGNYEAIVTDDTFRDWYGTSCITERHRHRYEMSTDVLKYYATSDLVVTARNKADTLVEAIRIHGKTFLVGCQYHPEYRSRFTRPHPLFVELLRAGI